MADDGNGSDCGGSRELEGRSSMREIGGTSGGLRPHIGSAGSGSREEPVPETGTGTGTRTGRRFRGSGTELNADLLAEVFSHLPQRQLFEMMLVSRSWKKAVVEGSALWRKVEVIGEWNLGAVGVEWMEEAGETGGMEGRGPRALLQVLRAAEVASFSKYVRYDMSQMMAVGGALGGNLRSLTLHGRSVPPPFIPLLLANCPNLKSLVVDRELVKGIESVQICHPRLERLKLNGEHFFRLIIDCPALLDLYFGVDTYDSKQKRRALRAPSLNCPRLTSLHLSDWHSPEGVVEAIAAHAPNIKRLKTCVNTENPFSTLTQFKALRELSLFVDDQVLPLNAFVQLPNLERLEVGGHGISVDLELSHTGLRSLTLKEFGDWSRVLLDCPVLEEIEIGTQDFDCSWDDIVESSCPRLKKIHIVWDAEYVDYKEEDEPFGFYDETVEELVLEYLIGQGICIECHELERLQMSWSPFAVSPLSFPEIVCCNLTSIALDGYPFVLPSIPSLLSAQPDLKDLRILCFRENTREVVLEHEKVCDVVIGTSEEMVDHASFGKVRVIIVDEFELTLMMPSLLRVDVEKSNVRVLKVAARERGIVKCVTAENKCNVIEMDSNWW